MSPSATVEGGERPRLFCALPLPDRGRSTRWSRGRARARGRGRLVPRANLHITVAFLGARPSATCAAVAAELREAAASAAPIHISVARYRETRSVGMLVLDDAAAARARSRPTCLCAARPARRLRAGAAALASPRHRRSVSGAAAAATGAPRPRTRSVRPAPLFTFPGCAPAGRSTRFSNRLP